MQTITFKQEAFMKDTKFFICEKCGNLMTLINSSGVPVVCCGQKMTKLEAGTVDASREKHIPLVEVKENEVNVLVGSVIHPMSEEHNIAWVYIKTDKGGQIKHLSPTDEPKACFTLKNEKLLEVYAYCNLHGLWKAEI